MKKTNQNDYTYSVGDKVYVDVVTKNGIKLCAATINSRSLLDPYPITEVAARLYEILPDENENHFRWDSFRTEPELYASLEEAEEAIRSIHIIYSNQEGEQTK